MISLLSSECEALKTQDINSPKTHPSNSTPMFSANGLMTDMILKAFPDSEDTAMEMAILYMIRPTTSSRATTCNNVSTKSPFALVCLMVITVEAGAVAAAKAEMTIAKGRLSLSTMKVRMKTRILALRASIKVMKATLMPFLLRASRRKNSPVLKAMNARAISPRNAEFLMKYCGIRFSPNGPINMPTTM